MQAGVGQELCIPFMDFAGSALNATCLRLVPLLVFVLLVGKPENIECLRILHSYCL